MKDVFPRQVQVEFHLWIDTSLFIDRAPVEVPVQGGAQTGHHSKGLWKWVLMKDKNG